MYAVIVEYYGSYGAIVPLGAGAIQKLRNKTRNGWLKETECMRHSTTGTVYLIENVTKTMCEMPQRELANYVITHAISWL